MAAQNGWTQWGGNPQHSGASAAVAQTPDRVVSFFQYDPLVPDQQADAGGDLLAHYPAPIVDSGEVFMEFKAGQWTACSPPGSGKPQPCGSNAWESQIWNIKKFSWDSQGNLTEAWTFQSNWKPEPDRGGLGGWEPVFHAVLVGQNVYVPGAGGSVYRVNRSDGSPAALILPFTTGLDPNMYVAGPLVADGQGNVYYNVLKLDPAAPWNSDVAGAWLVKIAPDDSTQTVTYAALTPGAPAASDRCVATFPSSQLPWPPSPSAVPGTTQCGSQRPGVNIAPAIAADGTIYTVSRAHFNSRYGYMVAVNPDLTPKWNASMRGLIKDGCGTAVLPPSGQPGGCRAGANVGVDPATNDIPAARVVDDASSTPVAAPDGSVLYGSYTGYNYARGHLMKWGADGKFQASYDFGWDTSPAIYPHDGTYSVILKDNHYDAGSYCGDPRYCPAADPGPYSITRLSADLKPEWKFDSTNTLSCARQADGSLQCTDDHPGGFEWCINAPAVDAGGNVFANSEDGNLYMIAPDGTLVQNLFLNLALGAAYTPLAIGDDGRIYTENDGYLFVAGAMTPAATISPVRKRVGTSGVRRGRRNVADDR